MKGRGKPIVYKINNNGCHICTSHSCNGGGYPAIRWRKKRYSMHRLIYEWIHGEIPPQMIVMHTCDNPRCINPEHLILGTQRDNMHDCCLKNRFARGEKSGPAKLTEKDVKDIRRRHIRRGDEPNKRGNSSLLAEEYGIDIKNIWYIVNRKTWKHIK